MTPTFDTLDAARKLEAAGMERAHAEAVAGTALDAAAAGHLQFATKTDLADLKAELTWRLVIAAGVIVAAVKLIP